MTGTTTATIRTTVPVAWTTLLVWLVARFGIDLAESDWQTLMLVMPAIVGVCYRAARMIEARWPVVGHVLFGSAKTPTYGESSTGPTV